MGRSRSPSASSSGAASCWRYGTRTPGAPCTITSRWDGLRLEQIIDNLLSNATKFGPGKPIHLALKEDSGWARLSVRDFGTGIAPEAQARIFERFERAVSEENYGSFGLGLWISREVVQAHGGRISVESPPARGPRSPWKCRSLRLPPHPCPSSELSGDGTGAVAIYWQRNRTW